MEALPLSNVLKKAVRIISPNNPVFNLLVLNFFLKFEGTLLATRDANTGCHFFAKGLNYENRFQTIRKLSKKFKLCYSIDFKNFDAHHCDQNAKEEIEFFGTIGLPDLYCQQLLTAKHRGVIKHNALMRFSGDLFTGSGNCLTVGALLFPFVGKDTTFFCDGDDTLLFMNNRSDYEMISEHLRTRGYELGEPDIIEITHLKNNSCTYSIPFCQVEYHYKYYTKELDRLLNKAGNLAASNLDQLAQTILGKLQSFSILKAHGALFNIDLSKYLNGLDDDYELDYKRFLAENLQHYQQPLEREIDLKTGTSLIAQIARKFEYNKYRIFLTKVSNREKLLRKLIKEVLVKEYTRQQQQEQTAEALDRRIGAYVEDYGFEAIVPVLTSMYREMIQQYTEIVVAPPQTLNTTMHFFLENGGHYV